MTDFFIMDKEDNKSSESAFCQRGILKIVYCLLLLYKYLYITIITII